MDENTAIVIVVGLAMVAIGFMFWVTFRRPPQ